VFVMDATLASRLNEFIDIMTMDCSDGAKFDAEHPNQKRQSRPATIGQAICVAMNIITNSGSSGMFADLEKGEPHLALQDATPTAEDALRMIKDFAAAYSTVLGISTSKYFPSFVSAVVFIAVINDKHLGPQNVLPTIGNLGKWVIDGNPTSSEPTPTSKPGCPDPEQTLVSTCTDACLEDSSAIDN
jgi:hypothetical protein